MFVDFVAVAELDNAAEIHHRDPVADVAHHRQVVGDEQIGEAQFGLQVIEHVDDLGLDRDVQRRDRLVGDDEGRIGRQGAGHADALPLAAGELVGVATDKIGIEAHDAQQLLHPLLAAGRVADAVDGQRLADDVAHSHARIQRGIGVLEDHLHVTASAPHVAAADLGQFVVGKLHAAGRGHFQLQDSPAGGRLAAAAFADQTERLTLIDIETDAVNGLDVTDCLAQHAALDWKILLEISDLDEDLVELRWCPVTGWDGLGANLGFGGGQYFVGHRPTSIAVSSNTASSAARAITASRSIFSSS